MSERPEPARLLFSTLRIRPFVFSVPGLLLPCSLLLASLLIPATSLLAANAELGAESAKLKELRANIGDLKKQLDSVRGEHDTQQQQLEKTDREIGEIRRQLRRLDNESAAADARLTDLQQQKNTADAQLKKMSAALKRELRFAWTGGRQQRVKLLLNQEQPASLGRMLVYQEYFSRARIQRMEKYHAVLATLDETVKQLEEQQVTIATLREQQQQQADRLVAEQDKQRDLVARLQQKLQSGNAQLKQLEQDEQRVNQLVKSLQQAMRDIPAESGSRKSLVELKGRLRWPVAGRVSQTYGASRSSGQMVSRGVHISVPAGTDVRAVARGRVAFADWLRGFGLLLIIDHGSGYMSLYGENSSLYKGVGDWVEQGEVVSSAGSSGGQARTGVYLELRKDGQPVNPDSWFKGSPVQQQAGRD